MKFMLSIWLSLLSFFSLQAQTFVESFLKNKDSIAVYHNRKGQEMIPVVRFYLFADNLVPDTSGRIDAGRLLSQWNRYLLGKTTSIYDMYRQTKRKQNVYHYGSLAIEGEDKEGRRYELPWRYPVPFEDILEPDFVIQPYLVCYAPVDESDDSISFFIGLYTDKINHLMESRYSRSQFSERKVVCFDLCVDDDKWFLKGDSLYTGYVLDTNSRRMRFRTVQEALDDISIEAIHYLNSIDSACLIPVEKRQKIVRILDDEIICHYHDLIDNRGFVGITTDEEYIAIFGYRLVPCEEAYRRRGEENQYYGSVSYRRFPTKK